ncbi:hypothetical protein LY78DRAFT_260939 [Colletotrichum sublineola]|nr:hypothetical protein LY78DRAFT_260939 [Colletotrichum sublineola]
MRTRVTAVALLYWGGVGILGQSTGSSTSRDLFELPRPTGKHRSSDSEPFCLVARCPLLGVADGPRLTRVQVRATRKNPHSQTSAHQAISSLFSYCSVSSANGSARPVVPHAGHNLSVSRLRRRMAL